MEKALAGEGFPPVLYILPVVMAAVAVAVVVIHSFCYKIRIQKDGFYCRTTPFNGRYYYYHEITDCRLVEKEKKFGSALKGTRETRYFYYFQFADGANKTHRIFYNKALFELEMKVLMCRIVQARGQRQ